jgi:hypothetical protein
MVYEFFLDIMLQKCSWLLMRWSDISLVNIGWRVNSLVCTLPKYVDINIDIWLGELRLHSSRFRLFSILFAIVRSCLAKLISRSYIAVVAGHTSTGHSVSVIFKYGTVASCESRSHWRRLGIVMKMLHLDKWHIGALSFSTSITGSYR